MTILSTLLLADGHGHMGDWGGGWMWLWGTLMMVALVTLIGFAVWTLARGQSQTPVGGGHANAEPTASARTILAERYARGEISRDEYREKLEDLER